MKKAEIRVGGLYAARVSGKYVTVRVDAIRERMGFKREETVYDVTNLTTGRKTTFRSAAKFRSEAKPRVEETPRPFSVASESVPSVDSSEMLQAAESGLPCKEEAAVACPSCERDNGAPMPEGEQSSDPTTSAPAAVAPSQRRQDGAATLSVPVTVPTSNARFAALVAAPPPSVSGRTLTDEQQAVVAAAPHTPVLVIEAGAGCGKTSTLVEASQAMPGIGQYTAFNTSLVAESKRKFPARVRCNTIHSLAFGAEGKRFQHRLGGQRVRASEVAAVLGLTDLTVDGPDGRPKTLIAGLLASQLTRALRSFCQSADREVEVKHLPRFQGLDAEGSRTTSDWVRGHLLPYARKMWADKCDPNGRLPFCHDDYVKMWELDDPYIAADYVLLDEAQDTSPVMLSIMEAQVRRGTRVVLVGDSAQQIYGWRGAINALAAFPDAPRLMLSQSFRFGQVVAEVANAVLGHLSERTPLVMRGLDRIQSRLARLDAPNCVLCRTNAGAVTHLLAAIAAGKRPHLIGGGDEVVSFCRAALDLQQGRSTQHQELCCFTSWGEVREFARTDEGEDIRLMVKLIDGFGAKNIIAALERMPQEQDADLVISTAHKSKGREWKQVKLAGDFPPLEKMDDEGVRLLYVAATRAQEVLDLEECPPFCGGQKRAAEGWNGEGGEERTVDIGEARRLSRAVASAAQAAAVHAPGSPTMPPAAPESAAAVVAPPAPAAAPSGEAIRQIVTAAAGERVVTYTKLPSGEWGMWASAAIKEGELVDVRTKTGTTKRERVGKIIMVREDAKKWLATIDRA